MTGAVSFESVIVPLTVALSLSLMVERLLELVKNLFEYLIRMPPTQAIPTQADVEARAQAAFDARVEQKQRADVEAEAAKVVAALDAAAPDEKPRLRAHLAALQAQGEWSERVPHLVFTVEEATPPDMMRVLRGFVLQLLGLAAGIVLARVFELQLFHKFLGGAPQDSLTAAGDYILTGILIGGGSAPVHFLIQFISERRVPPAAVPIDAQESAESAPVAFAAAAPAPVAPVAPAAVDWVDIPYDGGVDRDRLERVHLRTADPDMIVFHHTAMSSSSTFEDVVRTIKEHTDGKGNHWLTGYNCVVMADGRVHPFCRWDRYGNHAVGYNERSLGIAFNGNFEPDPKVPFSNVNGRLGPVKPGPVQLRSAARVVALWTFLYGIKLDFAAAIIPHNKISQKTCPGSAFPYADFQALVMELVAKWKSSPAVMQEIERYKQRPYLYVKPGAAHG